MASTSTLRGDATRDQIKVAARRLFALKGIHGVTTREIVAELRPEQPVSILAEKGQWVQIRYEHEGETREGWIESVNLSSTTP